MNKKKLKKGKYTLMLSLNIYICKYVFDYANFLWV